MAWMVLVMAVEETTDEDEDAGEEDAERGKMRARRDKSD